MTIQNEHFHLIGDMLSRNHGENNCRILLSEILQEKGATTQISYKLSRDAFKPADTVILFAGGGRATLLYEALLLLHHIRRGSRVFVWHHNSSFSRWATMARCLRRAGPLTELCLARRQFAARAGVIFFPNTVQFPEGFDLGRQRPEKRKKLIWLSRLERQKGVHIAWDTFQELYRADPEWTFDIVGPVGDWELPESHSNVTYHGGKWDADKFEFLCSGGVFIFPSRYRNEIQPLAVQEAIAVSLPVVLSNHNGIDELIRSEDRTSVAGEAVPTRASPSEYAAAVRKVFGNWELHSESAGKISETYSLAAFKKRVDQVFGSELSDAI